MTTQEEKRERLARFAEILNKVIPDLTAQGVLTGKGDIPPVLTPEDDEVLSRCWAELALDNASLDNASLDTLYSGRNSMKNEKLAAFYKLIGIESEESSCLFYSVVPKILDNKVRVERCYIRIPDELLLNAVDHIFPGRFSEKEEISYAWSSMFPETEGLYMTKSPAGDIKGPFEVHHEKFGLFHL